MKTAIPIILIIGLAVGGFLWLRKRGQVDIDHAITGRWVEGGDVSWGEFGSAVKVIRDNVAPSMPSGEFYDSNHRSVLAWLKGHDVALSAGNVIRFKKEISDYILSGDRRDPDNTIIGSLL